LESTPDALLLQGIHRIKLKETLSLNPIYID